MSYTHSSLPMYTVVWARELEMEISPEEWHNSFTFTHKSSIACYIQEKKLSRWYSDPVTLSGIFPNSPDLLLALSQNEGHVYAYLVGM